MTGAAGGASGATGAVGERMAAGPSAARSERGRWAPGIGTPAAGRPIIVRPTGGAAGRGGIEGWASARAGPPSGRTGTVPGRAGRHRAGAHAGNQRRAHRPGRSRAALPDAGRTTTGWARGAAATAGAPVAIGSGVAGPDESMLISP